MTKRGYKNPPKEHQFKKGKSGNPKGRPRKKKAPKPEPLDDIIQYVNEEWVDTLEINDNGSIIKITKGKGVVKRVFAQAIAGKVSQQKLLLSLLALARGGETDQLTLEQLQSYDEDLLHELHEQLNSMNDDTPGEFNDQGDDVDD
ncbi:hypothetical protein HIMB11_03229 [Rhodobacteraceae bacterium HIMB11]|nr:hypothetical protein HIMB11_03229 [Rhodobacteraceae bacterium HIMB11]